jgi:hypothetical protein
MTATPFDPSWRPDPRTVSWVMSVIDEAAVGRDVIEQLRLLAPCLTSADPAVVGEAVVESALFRARRMAQDAQKVPPGTPL